MSAARFGAFFLFASIVLLIFASVSVPVWSAIYFVKADFTSSSSAKLGMWGLCQYSSGSSSCTSAQLGYRLDQVLASLPNSNNIENGISRGLTYALILNPIGAAIALIALLFALCGNVISHVFGSIVAFFAFLVTLVALAVDLAVFIIARNRINDSTTGNPAMLGNAMWLVVGACVAQLIAAFTVCCGGIRERKARRNSAVTTPVMTEGHPRRTWWRRNRYNY